MASIRKFYLHDVTSPNLGTMPSNTPATVAGGVLGAGTEASGATTARDANGAIGVANPDTESSITSAATSGVAQRLGHRRFVSRPLAEQTFTTADGNWSFNYARSQSNTNHVAGIDCSAYLWRPSTGARIGTQVISFAGALLAATAETTDNVSAAWSGTTSIVDGDILVFDVYSEFTQTMATAYTDQFAYDGTSDTSNTTMAAYVIAPFDLQLSQVGYRAQPFQVSFRKPIPSIIVPHRDTIETAPGPAIFDPTRDSAYDAIVLRDLPASGAYWKMNEKTGTSFQDRGPNDFDLTFLSRVELNKYPGPDAGDPLGNTSALFNYDPLGGNAVAGGAANTFPFPGRTAFSLEVWLYPLSDLVSDSVVLILFSFQGAGGGYTLQLVGNSGVGFRRTAQNLQDAAQVPSPPNLFVWTHLVATYDGDTMNVYQNGVLSATQASTISLSETMDGTLYLGQNIAVDFYMAKAAVYGGTALTQAQVTEHFQAATSSTWSPDPLVPGMRLPVGIPGRRALPINFFDLSIPTFPVSATVDEIWEALQGIADTSAEPYEATQTLADTSVEPWEATQPLAKTSQEPLEALLGIKKTPPVFSTPVIDDFNRADENPLSGSGNWANVTTGSSSRLKLVSNQVTAFSGNESGAYWTPLTLTDCEAYVTVATLPGLPGDVGVTARIQDVSSGDTFDGYAVLVVSDGTLSIYRYTDGNQSQIAVTSSGTVVAGDGIGIRCVGTTIEAWLLHGGTWTKQLTVVDATYSSGALGLWASGTTGRADDFGGGALGVPYEVTGGIAGTKSDPWDAVRALAATKSDPWEANTKLRATAIDSYEALWGIAAKTDLRREFVDDFSSLVSGRYSFADANASVTAGLLKFIVPAGQSSVVDTVNSFCLGGFQWDNDGALQPDNISDGHDVALYVYHAATGMKVRLYRPLEGTSYVELYGPSGLLFALSGSYPHSFRLRYRFSDNSWVFETSQSMIASIDAGVGRWIVRYVEPVTGTENPFLNPGPIEIRGENNLGGTITKTMAIDDLTIWSVGALSYESLQGIAATKSDPWEAIQAIAASNVLPWESLITAAATISQTAELPIESLVSLAATKSDPWDALVTLAKSASEAYEANQGVAASQSEFLEAMQGLASTRSDQWESLQAIFATEEDPWESLKAIAASGNADAWEALQSVAGIKSDPWESIAAIAKNSSAFWEASIMLAAIRQGSWESLQALSATTSDPWEGLRAIATTVQEVYEALVAIAITASDPNEALRSIATSTPAPWDATGNVAVTQTSVLVWEAIQALAASPGLSLESLQAIFAPSGHNARPAADILATGWSSTAATLFEALDEVQPLDADFISATAI